jgi:arsenite methyltransferase
MTTLATFDPKDLEAKVKAMYRRVAEDPHGEFHFEMGRALAERLGYAPADLDRIPAEAIESFAGVGYYFDLGALKEGETVVDLGSGSGMDTFVAALKVGQQGHVIGIDMTDAQLDKAERLRAAGAFSRVAYRKGYIDKIPCDDASADVVISNGVINLTPDKAAVFREAARLLKRGSRLAIADIVTATRLPDTVTSNADLWAACIGGAMQQDNYQTAIESAGLRVTSVRDNAGYRFISANARRAQEKWGVKSISLLAVKS